MVKSTIYILPYKATNNSKVVQTFSILERKHLKNCISYKKKKSLLGCSSYLAARLLIIDKIIIIIIIIIILNLC